jgi:hypothetical protein
MNVAVTNMHSKVKFQKCVAFYIIDVAVVNSKLISASIIRVTLFGE